MCIASIYHSFTESFTSKEGGYMEIRLNYGGLPLTDTSLSVDQCVTLTVQHTVESSNKLHPLLTSPGKILQLRCCRLTTSVLRKTVWSLSYFHFSSDNHRMAILSIVMGVFTEFLTNQFPLAFFSSSFFVFIMQIWLTETYINYVYCYLNVLFTFICNILTHDTTVLCS